MEATARRRTCIKSRSMCEGVLRFGMICRPRPSIDCTAASGVPLQYWASVRASWNRDIGTKKRRAKYVALLMHWVASRSMPDGPYKSGCVLLPHLVSRKGRSTVTRSGRRLPSFRTGSQLHRLVPILAANLRIRLVPKKPVCRFLTGRIDTTESFTHSALNASGAGSPV